MSADLELGCGVAATKEVGVCEFVSAFCTGRESSFVGFGHESEFMGSPRYLHCVTSLPES